MPYDANGNYTLPPVYKVANGQKVLPSQHNPPFEDVRNALSSIIVADGRKAMAGDLKMGGNRVTGLIDGINSQDAATVGQSAAAIGDGKWSLRALGDKWLRRDGGIYNVADYPDLATLYPALPDGVNWTNLTSGASTTIRSIISTVARLLQVEDDGTNTKIRTSTDSGDNWTLAATINTFRGYCVAFGAGVYVLGNGAAATVVSSSDGTTWGSPVTITGFGAEAPTGIAYGAGVFVIIGTGGKISTSPDTATWTARTSGTTQGLFGVSFINSVFVVVGANGTILTSPDGINWTARTSGVTTLLRSVTYGAGVYVVVGSGGVILSSSNLSSWTARSSGTTQDLNGVAYTTAGFLTAGNAGTVRISTNGTSWAASVTSTSSNLLAVAGDANTPAKYYAAGNSGATIRGLRTLPTQFQVSNDGANEWVRALA